MPDQEKPPTSAAAMDALDLDDLFLGGVDDDDDVVGGGGGGDVVDGPDSLFANMEIDLGEMGAIFDGGVDPVGGSGVVGYDNDGRGSTPSGGGGGDVLTQEFGRQSFNSGGGGARDRKRVRTAKTNPHLLAAELQNNNNEEGNKSASAKRQSAIQKELQRLQDSATEMMDGIGSKRKRRRSKKSLAEDELLSPHPEKEKTTSTSTTAKNSKKRRSSSKVIAGASQADLSTLNSTLLSSATQQQQQQQQPLLQQQQHALQVIIDQMNPQQKQRLQKKAEAMGLNIFAAAAAAFSNNKTNTTNNNSNKVQNKISEFGLQPSTTEFYPYMTLPSELDIKRGVKLFPILEKINSTSAPSSHHHHHIDQNSSTPLESMTSATITNSSPLYTLFHQHLGLTNENGIPDLINAVKLTQRTLRHTTTNEERKGGNHKKRISNELSKLLTQCLKQSGFIKQNLVNMESWVKSGGGRWSHLEIQSLFPVGGVAGGGGGTLLGSTGGNSATNVNTLPSKKGTPNAPTHGGPNSTPVIGVKVKVRVTGWREKSGTKLTARLWCPLGWKVALNKANLDAEALSSSSPASTSVSMTKSTTSSRKRKAKESSSTSSGPSATNKGGAAAANNRSSVSKIVVPFISGHHDEENGQQEQKQGEKKHHQQQHHNESSIIQSLYNKILHPSNTPTQRRELLANEISSTLSRLESARLTNQWTKARKVQVQMKALESVYRDDIDIVPDMCNTIGMWRWMEHTNYFKEIDEKDDVKQELEDCLGERGDKGDTVEEDETLESKGRVVSEEGTYWGSSMKRRRVSTVDYGDGEEKEKESHGSNDNVQSSPLFDRLQSLLVEVDGSDDEDENDDDDDLIASLPPFSTNEFIHGPSSSSGGGGSNDVAHDNKEIIDVSALSLDQRTFIQLRAAGLINAKTHPSRVLQRGGFSSSSIPENSEGESISLILQRMKSRLTSLQNESHVDIKTLQRKALLHVKQASERKQKEREDDAVLSKYTQLQKEQKEKKRSSSRAKAGSNKFRDGDGE